MILGMSPLLFVHVALSLIGIATGLVVLYGLLTGKPGKPHGGWTPVFLATTVLTSLTGFPLPATQLLPSHIVGVLSLVLLAIAIVALYVYHLAGRWRWIYVATALAALYSIALMDAFLPGVGDWTSVWLLRDLWHFHFYGKTALALVEGRERIYLEHFWNDFAADPAHSVSEPDRQFYAAAYARPGAMRAGFEAFRAFERDARDFAGFATTKLKMPMLVLTGEKASGEFLIQQGRLVAGTVEGVVVKGSGHWLMDEAPEQVIPKLVSFFAK